MRPQVLLHYFQSESIITAFLRAQTYNDQNNTKKQRTPME